MVSSALKKFAEPLGFENKNERVFGEYRGYHVTLLDGMGYKSMMIGVTITKDDPRVNQIVGLIETSKLESGVQGYSIHPSHIMIRLMNNIGTMKRLTALLDKLITMLEELGVPGSNVCWYCKGEFAGVKPEKVQVNEAVVPMHAGCFESYSQSLQQASEEFHNEDKNYLRGTLGAVLGGLVGIIPWVIVFLLGYFVGWLGFIVGFAAEKGYALLGGKPGKAKPWIIVIIVIFMVLFGQFVGEIIDLNIALHNEGYSGFSILELPPFVMELLVYEPEYRSSVLANVSVGLIFAFLGMFSIIKDMRKEGKGGFASVKKLN